MDTLYRQVQTALAAGMATDNDLLRIEAKRSNIRYQLQKGVNGADLCRLSLCRIIGVSSETQIEPADTAIVVSESGNLTTDIADRPELNLLKSQIAVNEQQIRMTRADMLPTVGLTAGYTYFGNVKLNSIVDAGGGMMVPYSQEFRDGIGVAMLVVQIPIFHWGEGRKKVRKAQFELQNAQLE